MDKILCSWSYEFVCRAKYFFQGSISVEYYQVVFLQGLDQNEELDRLSV